MASAGASNSIRPARSPSPRRDRQRVPYRPPKMGRPSMGFRVPPCREIKRNSVIATCSRHSKQPCPLTDVFSDWGIAIPRLVQRRQALFSLVALCLDGPFRPPIQFILWIERELDLMCMRVPTSVRTSFELKPQRTPQDVSRARIEGTLRTIGWIHKAPRGRPGKRCNGAASPWRHTANPFG